MRRTPMATFPASSLRKKCNDHHPASPAHGAPVRKKKPAAHDEFVHYDALEVLCRVFPDGADARFEKWKAFYRPKDWLRPSRALGAFIYTELRFERERAAIASLEHALDLLGKQKSR